MAVIKFAYFITSTLYYRKDKIA